MDPEVPIASSSSSSPLSSSSSSSAHHPKIHGSKLPSSSSSSSRPNQRRSSSSNGSSSSSSIFGCGACYPLPPHHQHQHHHQDRSYSCWFLHDFLQCGTWNCWTAPAKVENSSMDSPAAQVCKVPPSEQSMDGSETPHTPRGEEELLARSHLRKFSYSDLRVATRNFRPDSLLGEGGFGCVFKGWVDEHGTSPVKPGTGLTVAVKTLNKNSLQGHNEWLAEVYYLSQLHHPNLVKLIGFCIENDQRLLVYEFMQRGSLENHLFRRGAMPLSWETRMKIARGAAEGLAFLHGRKKAVIYRDFKASNILLDVDYNSKLSDFGLAKDGPEGDKSHVSTRVMGTYGYAAPEYVMTGHLTARSDVYSFGVVLLEILTGKRSVDKSRPSGEHNLVEWARPYFSEKKKVFRLIDPRMPHYSEKGSFRAAQLAFQCLSRDPRVRPAMHDVVEALGQIQGLKDIADNPHYQPAPDSRSSRSSRS